MSLARRAVRVLVPVVVLVLAAGALAAAAWARAEGVRVVPVVTGSMRPTAPPGSLAVTVPVAPDRVRVGDVVAFMPPEPFDSDGHPVMHRVAELTTSGGTPVMRTRGDANEAPDPWTVALPGADLARTVAVAPLVGWAVAGGRSAALAGALGVVLLLVAAQVAVSAGPAHEGHARGCTCAMPRTAARARPAAARAPAAAVGTAARWTVAAAPRTAAATATASAPHFATRAPHFATGLPSPVVAPVVPPVVALPATPAAAPAAAAVAAPSFAAAAPASGAEAEEVRAWAAEHGITVAARGPLSPVVVELHRSTRARELVGA